MSRRAHGEGTVYRRPDGRWCGQLRPLGQPRQTVYGKTQREALERLAAARKAFEGGLSPGSRSRTMSDFLRQWLDATRSRVRPSTLEAYELNIRRLTPHIGRIRLGDLNAAAIQATYGRLLEAGLSPRSVEQAHTVLHAALAQAARWGLVGRNPAASVAPPRPQRHEMRTLTVDQLLQLFEHTRGHRLHALWVLLATSGLRLGEALGLTWEDVDFDNGRLVVRRALRRQRGAGLVLAEPKTAKSRRTVHLASAATEALREHRRQQAQLELASERWLESGLIFTSLNGGPMESGVANDVLNRALIKLGLPRIRIHDLRHTAATLLLESGAHPKVVQELLGHSTITLTLDTYSHVTPALHHDAATRMDRLLANPGRSTEVRI